MKAKILHPSEIWEWYKAGKKHPKPKGQKYGHGGVAFVSFPDYKSEIDELNAEIKSLKDADHGLYKYGQGCRCDICKAAKRESMQKYFKNKAIKAKTKGV